MTRLYGGFKAMDNGIGQCLWLAASFRIKTNGSRIWTQNPWMDHYVKHSKNLTTNLHATRNPVWIKSTRGIGNSMSSFWEVVWSFQSWSFVYFSRSFWTARECPGKRVVERIKLNYTQHIETSEEFRQLKMFMKRILGAFLRKLRKSTFSRRIYARIDTTQHSSRRGINTKFQKVT